MNAAGGSYGNWGLPRFFRRSRATGMIGRRSAYGRLDDLLSRWAGVPELTEAPDQGVKTVVPSWGNSGPAKTWAANGPR